MSAPSSASWNPRRPDGTRRVGERVGRRVHDPHHQRSPSAASCAGASTRSRLPATRLRPLGASARAPLPARARARARRRGYGQRARSARCSPGRELRPYLAERRARWRGPPPARLPGSARPTRADSRSGTSRPAAAQACRESASVWSSSRRIWAHSTAHPGKAGPNRAAGRGSERLWVTRAAVCFSSGRGRARWVVRESERIADRALGGCRDGHAVPDRPGELVPGLMISHIFLPGMSSWTRPGTQERVGSEAGAGVIPSALPTPAAFGCSWTGRSVASELAGSFEAGLAAEASHRFTISGELRWTEPEALRPVPERARNGTVGHQTRP